MTYYLICVWPAIVAALVWAPVALLYRFLRVVAGDPYNNCSGARIVWVAAAFCTCWPLALALGIILGRTYA